MVIRDASLREDLPPKFAGWFAARGWQIRDHQMQCLEAAANGQSFLLSAPTGGGKTLAGFLPSLIALDRLPARRERQLHTLYISPLKALSVDVARNLQSPIDEMGLNISVETRTGDTPSNRRARQRIHPPDILLTTPESLSLLIADEGAGRYFQSLERIIIDEIHALAPNKRGELMSLALARLRTLAPKVAMIGLSATAPEPDALAAYLTPQNRPDCEPAKLINAASGAVPQVDVLASENRIPWSGHSGRHCFAEVYKAIAQSELTLVFVNTRSQAEITFAALWDLNDEGLAIALHHGSLEIDRRRKVEAAMAAGELRAIVCTSTLDLGIDWGDVDLVIQMGAPKGVSRLTQRVGRANHRMNEPSRALLAPANRMEVLECIAAKGAIEEGALDGSALRRGGLDVLAQHILGVACAGPFDADALFHEVCSAAPYAKLARKDFDDALNFVADGGYALRRYDQFKRIVKDADGLFRIRDQRARQQYKMNVGAIVEAPTINIRLARGKGPLRAGSRLGTAEESFFDSLLIGDAFYFAGEILRLERIDATDAIVTRTTSDAPRIPVWGGAKFPWSTFLADRVRTMLSDPQSWTAYPDQLREWLEKQSEVSALPGRDDLLVETFPFQDRHFLMCYPFEGWLAHQTLGILITRRLERLGVQPLGYVPTEYGLSIWARKDMSHLDMKALFEEDLLGDDLENWLKESVMMKHTFRNCAVIAGLIERRYPGQAKTGRQVAFSSNLIYDVLREHEPDHLLLRAAWDDAAAGYLDLARLQGLLSRIQGRVGHMHLDRPSPLAVPLMLEIGRESVARSANDAALASISQDIIDVAMA